MAFSLGIVTNLKIWYNTRMKSKERRALGNAPPKHSLYPPREKKERLYDKSHCTRLRWNITNR